MSEDVVVIPDVSEDCKAVERLREILLLAGFSAQDMALVLLPKTNQVAIDYEELDRNLRKAAAELEAFRKVLSQPRAKAISRSKSKYQRRRERGW